MLKNSQNNKTRKAIASAIVADQNRNQGGNVEENKHSAAPSDGFLNDIEAGLKNLEILEKEFPTLDTSLISAIHSDTPLDLLASRHTLSTLASVTILGEADEIPSSSDDGKVATEASSTAWITVTSTADGSDEAGDEELEESLQTKDSKVRYLKELFPSLSEFVITKALERSQGVVNTAAEELSNYPSVGARSTVKSSSQSGCSSGRLPQTGGYYLKGLNDPEHHASKPNSGKKRRNDRKNERNFLKDRDKPVFAPPMSSSSAPAPVIKPEGLLLSGPQQSAWKKLESEASFLSSALGIPAPIVTSAYHKNNGSLPDTIYYLLDNHASPHSTSDGIPVFSTMWEDEIGQSNQDLERVAQLVELFEIFPQVEENILWRLLRRVTSSSDAKNMKGKNSSTEDEERNNIENLFRIAEFLKQNPRRTTSSPAETLSATPSPPSETSSFASEASSFENHGLAAANEPSEFITINSRSKASFFSTQSHLPYIPNPTPEAIYSARQNAFYTALSHYKRSRSDRLHGAAASYYSVQASQFSSLARSYSAPTKTSWDKLHESGGYKKHETHTMLDLHGLTLPEAIHVTKVIVEEWWEEENERKQVNMEKRVRPLIVVTGLGRHSKDGRGVLGGGVVKALKNAGWRLVWETGQIRVTGKEKVK